MRLEKLSLYNFKNYRDAKLEFGGAVQCLLGRNGSGKTNLLDAIHYLSFTKSAINSSDQHAVYFGEDHFLIKGEFENSTGRHTVACSYQVGQRKVILEDDLESSRLSAHIGKYPVVLVAPGDIALVWEGSETRRRFFDSLLSQIDKTYLDQLIVYNKFVRQRNGLLRIFQEEGRGEDLDLLAVYDEQLVISGTYIHARRKTFMNEFVPAFLGHYRFLADEGSEDVNIEYRSQLDHVDFRSELRLKLQRDIATQRTSTGIHRDDFPFTIHGGELRQLGSQGQQKSFLIALKLTEFQMLERRMNTRPLLLLDDIFDKLDDFRIGKLLSLVSGGTFGQIILTDARPGRSEELVGRAGVEADIIEVESGTFRRNG